MLSFFMCCSKYFFKKKFMSFIFVAMCKEKRKNGKRAFKINNDRPTVLITNAQSLKKIIVDTAGFDLNRQIRIGHPLWSNVFRSANNRFTIFKCKETGTVQITMMPCPDIGNNMNKDVKTGLVHGVLGE